MATTYQAIATVEVGAGGAASIDFTSIAADFTDLVVLLSARTTQNTGNANVILVQFNSSSSGYTWRTLIGDGATASSFNQTAITSTAFFGGYGNQATNTSNTFSSHYLYIPNYASSAYKSISVDAVQENNATTALASMSANLWSNTSAITSITFTALSSFNFVQYSTATLYGISNS